MEGMIGLAFHGANPMNVQKKRRSFASRRPRADPQFFHDSYEFLSLSPALASEGGTFDKAPSDDNWGNDTSHKQKELRSINDIDAEYTPRRSSSEDSKSRQISERLGELDDIPMSVSVKYYSSKNAARSGRKNQFQSIESGSKRVKVGSGESERNGRKNSVLGSDNVSHSSQENKLRKVKLKVGGITHTIHAKPTPNSRRPPRSSDVSGQRRKLSRQDKLNGESQSPPDSGNGFQGALYKDLKGPVRKSNRVPKRRMLDGDDDDDGDYDDELRYLDKLKSSKANAGFGAEYDDGYQAEGNHKQRSSRASKKPDASKLYQDTDYEGGTPSRKENRKKGRSRDTDDLYSVDEDESGFADEDDETVSFNSGSRRKKPKSAPVLSPADDKEIPLTTRQRALQSAKDPSSGGGLVEFPDGLPLAAPKKQKERLTDVEQQLKKAEAAQRRRMQVEKAARESEAQAIRKILGQDANGKKKEDKLRKRIEEMAQEKAARAMTIPSNTVRWTMGPSGTVVTFPEDVSLPSIFSSPPCSYPPPREKCAGPSCANTYKYRDSKTNLPLCSLQCYKAVNQMREQAASC